MRFEAVGLHSVTRVLLVAAFAALLPGAVSAAEPATASHRAAATAETSDGTSGTSVPSHGVVIRWSSVRGRYESPAREQAAELVSELQRLLATGLAREVGLATSAPIVERTASGLARARVPARFVDLALLRVAADGSLAPSCTQGPARALQVLSQVPAEPAER